MYIAVNGVRLFFDVEGAGLVPGAGDMREKPTVVLAHGGPGADHSTFKPFFAQLSDIAQVIYYDHRANGRSESGDPVDWTLAQWADDLRALCDALGVKRPIVIGNSFGGFVAQAYAIRHPGHAGGLGLISTGAWIDLDEVYAAFARRGGDQARDIARSYWEAPSQDGLDAYRAMCFPLYTTTQAAGDWASRVIWRDEVALHFHGRQNEMGRMDFRAALPGVTCPVLILAGEDDPITPPVFSDTMAAALPSGLVTYHRFANCGHGVMRDQPELTLSALRAFIRKVADHTTQPTRIT